MYIRAFDTIYVVYTRLFSTVTSGNTATLETELDEAATLGKAPRVQEPVAVPWYAGAGRGQRGSARPRRWWTPFFRQVCRKTLNLHQESMIFMIYALRNVHKGVWESI